MRAIAGVCEELGIAAKIDILIRVHDNRKISAGKAIVAMIFNGLGFSARRLYLTRHFYENKPIQLLLGADTALEHDLLGPIAHLDSTSMSVSGSKIRTENRQ